EEHDALLGIGIAPQVIVMRRARVAQRVVDMRDRRAEGERVDFARQRLRRAPQLQRATHAGRLSTRRRKCVVRTLCRHVRRSLLRCPLYIGGTERSRFSADSDRACQLAARAMKIGRMERKGLSVCLAGMSLLAWVGCSKSSSKDKPVKEDGGCTQGTSFSCV